MFEQQERVDSDPLYDMNINDEIGNGFSDNYNHLRLFGAQTNNMNLMAGLPN